MDRETKKQRRGKRLREKEVLKPFIPERSELVDAARKDNTQEVIRLIDNKADVNKPDIYGDYALYWACANASTELIEFLLENKANPNNNSGTSCLSLACSYINLPSENIKEIVKKLLDHGANVNTEESSPLKNAMKNNSLDVVKLLVEHKANINEDSILDDSLLSAITLQASSAEINQQLSSAIMDNVKYLVSLGIRPKEKEHVMEIAEKWKANDIISYLENL